MSDHFSGPRALADRAADLIDVFAFPAPANPQRLVVVMDVFGKAGPTAVFSDAVIYRFRFRRAAIAATGPTPPFPIDAAQVLSDDTCEAPSESALANPRQRAYCRNPDGETLSFDTNDERGGSGRDVRVF